MGYRTSAYHFYGIHVPADQWVEDDHPVAEGERIDMIVRALAQDARDIGYVTAGDYDRDMLFLVASGDDDDLEVELGTFRCVSGDQAARPEWDHRLRRVADAMGYELPGEPGWITVPDLS